MALIDSCQYDPTKLFEKPMIEITQSSLGCFNSCRQMFVLKYLMGLKPRTLSMPLITGTAVHLGMEVLLDNQTAEMDINERIARAAREIDAYFDRLLDDSLNCIGQEEKLNYARSQAQAMVKAWAFTYLLGGTPIPFQITKAEFTVRVPKEGVDTSSPLFMRMACKIDGLGIDLTSNEDCILETKTKGSITGYNWMQGLNLDRQLLWYITCARQYTGKPISRALYNVLVKPRHKAGKDWFELTGRMFEAIVADPSKYFVLEPVQLYEDALVRQYENWERIVSDMDNLTPNNVTQNTSACDDWGSGCPFKILCAQCVDAGRPETVLALPESEMFRFGNYHEELDDVEDSE